MISVIVPVYNAECYLPKCLDSILKQTYRNFELIIVDDGSTDSSPDICEIYAQTDARVRVFHVPNGGPSKARNIGMDHAAGEFWMFVDADDYIAPNMMEVLYEAIDNADVAMCNYYLCQDDKQQAHDHGMGNAVYRKNDILPVFMKGFYYGDIDGLGSLCNKLYRADFINDKQLRIDEQLIRAEDFWFNFDVLEHAEAVVTLTKPLYYYMQVNVHSTMHQIRKTQYEDWKANRCKLIKRNQYIGLNIDFMQFYKKFLYNVSVYIRTLIVGGSAKNDIMCILSDDFYQDALQYDQLLPKHIRLLDFVARKNSNIAYCCYKIWAKIA